MGGITATLIANIGELNGTTSGFGINAPGTDDTDALDGGDGIETVTITFDQPVYLTEVRLSSLSSGEVGTLTINSFPSILLVDTGVGTDIFIISTDNFLATGESVTVSYTSGN